MGLATSKSKKQNVVTAKKDLKFSDGYLKRSRIYEDDVEIGEQPLPKMTRCSTHNDCRQHLKHLDRGYNYFKYDFDYAQDNFWLHDDTDTVAGNISPASNKLIIYVLPCVAVQCPSKKTTTIKTPISYKVKINKVQLWRKKIFKGYNEKIIQKWQEFRKHFAKDEADEKLEAQKRYNDALLDKVWQDVWEQQNMYAYHNNYAYLYYNHW